MITKVSILSVTADIFSYFSNMKYSFQKGAIGKYHFLVSQS